MCDGVHVCDVVWREVLSLSRFSLGSCFLVMVSHIGSRFRWDCTAGCLEHTQKAPVTPGFGITALLFSSWHNKESPVVVVVVLMSSAS